MTDIFAESDGVNGAKAAKFKRLAEARVTKILRLLDQIGRLSRRTSYDYSPEQVTKIFDTIGAKEEEVEALFGSEHKTKPDYNFTL